MVELSSVDFILPRHIVLSDIQATYYSSLYQLLMLKFTKEIMFQI